MYQNQNQQIRWQQELDLYRKYKSLFILEGNVNDATMDNDSIVGLDNYLYTYFHQVGYNAVIFFNHVDGFYVPMKGGDGDLKIFRKIQSGNFDNEEVYTDKNQENQDLKFSKFNEATTSIRKCVRNDKYAVVVILKLASRYITAPDRIQASEQYLFSELLLASQEKQVRKKLLNLVMLVADKINDIPPWIYIGNNQTKTLTIQQPDKNMRQKYIDANYENFQGVNANFSLDKIEKLKRQFVDFTDGFTLIDIENIFKLMNERLIPLDEIEKAVSIFKYGIKDNPWSDPGLFKRLSDLEKEIHERVKGQEHCVKQSIDIITRSVLGLSGIQHSSSKAKPKGVMFLAGPTGTGKTELAKSIAQWLFGTEDACIRFDMSEYQQSHSDQKLLGAPPGYVGYEAGGQLTNAVKQHPFSVLLFDEIEKADPSILDKFLQILEDGRMTDGRGETVHFSDSLIIFTSNLGIYSPDPINPNQNILKVPMAKTKEEIANYDYEEYRKNIMEEIKNYFTIRLGRPEILNRLGENFIIFEYIDEKTSDLIANSLIEKITNRIKKQYDFTLILSQEVRHKLFEEMYKNLDKGGRGIGSLIEASIINPLARNLAPIIASNQKFTELEIVFINIIEGYTTIEIVVR